MFIIQSHNDLLTNSMYHDCKEATEYRFPASINHMEILRRLTYLATIENGVVTHVQALTAVEDIIYIYVDKISPQLMNELRMVLRPHVVAHPGKFHVVCKPEGRSTEVPALNYGFTIPESLQSIEKLAPIIGEKHAPRQLELARQITNPHHQHVLLGTPDEDIAEYFVDCGLIFVHVCYQL